MKVYKVNDSKIPTSAMYIGRGSNWGNPFIIGKHGERNEVIAKYLVYAIKRLASEPEWLKPLEKATGLVCFCAPKACHGDVLSMLMKGKVE